MFANVSCNIYNTCLSKSKQLQLFITTQLRKFGRCSSQGAQARRALVMAYLHITCIGTYIYMLTDTFLLVCISTPIQVGAVYTYTYGSRIYGYTDLSTMTAPFTKHGHTAAVRNWNRI